MAVDRKTTPDPTVVKSEDIERERESGRKRNETGEEIGGTAELSRRRSLRNRMEQIKKQFPQTGSDQCETVYFSLECGCISPRLRYDYPDHRTAIVAPCAFRRSVRVETAKLNLGLRTDRKGLHNFDRGICCEILALEVVLEESRIDHKTGGKEGYAQGIMAMMNITASGGVINEYDDTKAEFNTRLLIVKLTMG
ncbi:hypothetical protein GWI33_014621 [Rhynchophorus ferrugineus]|uniref:Uncharacterized protein n=1 Tax=Rhynchophorus ferrugineus TaxID=354439 RepID=A0A834MC63_RHYFE|nr:hypothetical protein GWI33_014621 [Rhynchophorus ferrugineus]